MNKYLKFIIVYYIFLSFSEWFLHKYIMHSNNKSIFSNPYSVLHLKHHIEVQNNMNLNRNNENHDGLIFQWSTIFGTFIFGLVFLYFMLPYLNFKNNILRNSLIISFITNILYGILWNTLHPVFHDIDLDIPIKEGFPIFNFLKRKHNPIVIWLYKNHTLHHVIKGKNKGNYNIILPGADFILGTYNSEIDNKEFCNDKENNKKSCNLVKNSKDIGGSVKECKNKIDDICDNNYSIKNYKL